MFDWLALLPLLPIGAIVWFLIAQAIKRHQKWNDRYWTKADQLLRELEAHLDTLRPVLSMPHKHERQPNGTILTTRHDDKTIIEWMNRVGHRPALYKWSEKLVEAGLVRLSHALFFYNDYTGREGDKWWERQWWLGNPCLNYGQLLAIERTISRTIEDTQRALRNEPPKHAPEYWRDELSLRPFVEFPRHWFFRAHRIPGQRWKRGRRPPTARQRLTQATIKLFVPRGHAPKPGPSLAKDA